MNYIKRFRISDDLPESPDSYVVLETSVDGEWVRFNSIFDLNSPETMDKSKRYLAVSPSKGNDPDAFTIVQWSPFANDWMSATKAIVQSMANIPCEKWTGTPIKGWALELSDL